MGKQSKKEAIKLLEDCEHFLVIAEKDGNCTVLSQSTGTVAFSIMRGCMDWMLQMKEAMERMDNED